MPPKKGAKKVTVKKTKQKQAVNVNVVVNSNNRRRTVAGSGRSQPQTIYIPGGSQSAPVVLQAQAQPQPHFNTDIASHVETLVKKYTPPEKKLEVKSEPEKTLAETSKEVMPIPVKIKEEPVGLNHHPVKTEGLLEPKYVSAKSESPSDSDYLSTRTRKAKFLSDSEYSNSDVPSENAVKRLFETPRSVHVKAEPLRAQSLITEARAAMRPKPKDVGVQAGFRRNRAGQASLVQYFNAHEIPVKDTNISAMKKVLSDKGLLDDYYRKPKGRQGKNKLYVIDNTNGLFFCCTKHWL